ncbi:hypothetical protein [Legionella sp.]|uniref:hypothetical protein n=1 Tax=Legionella sp. TaxID=459 RepID=UPI003C93805C
MTLSSINRNSVLNGLSSFSAFVLAQRGAQVAEAVASLVTIGVVGAATLTLISYKEWKSYEENKHKEKIMAVNTLYKRHLQNLTTSSNVPVPELPQIFQFSADFKTINSLHYDDDEIDDIGQVLPRVPVELTKYRRYILDALLKLKEYYFQLSKNDDVTIGVISYFMNILQNRALSFLGYDYDITYLRAIIAFINHYASIEDKENSPHFSHLKPVYTSLMYAVQDLEKHKESMSLRELVDQARNACLEESDNLIRLLVKMVTPKKYQNLIATVTHSELTENILREKYIDYELWGISFETKEVELPQSIFHNWIMGIAKYYLQSINPYAILHREKIFPPEEPLAFINWAQSILTLEEAAKNDKRQQTPSNQDKKKLHDELNLINKTFQQSPNFLNIKLVTTGKEFVLIKNNQELLNASETMANFTHLIHGVISLQAFCAELSNNMDQLGLDFFDNQDNFNKIFAAFNALYTVVQNDLNQIKQKMEAIFTASKNIPRLANEIQLQNDVSKALKRIEFRIFEAADKVKSYKNKHPHTINSSVKEALSAADFFEKMYGLKSPSIPESAKIALLNEASPITEAKQSAPTIPQMELTLNELNSELFKKIPIQKEQHQDSLAATYQKIFHTLRELQIKSIKLLKEKKQGPDRLNKAQNLYKLTCSLHEETLQFLVQTPEDRIQKTNKFIEKIHTQLNCVENRAFIDRHHHSLSKLIHENFGLFPTATRNKMTALEHACQCLRTNEHVRANN